MPRIKPARTLTATLLGVALLAGGASSADAARPHKGATYKGTIKETFETKVLATQPIAFTVDPKGKTVSNFLLHKGYPVYCTPAGIGEAVSVTAKIEGGGFRAVMPIMRLKQRQGSVTVTGSFGRHGLASGMVITHFMNSRHARCDGTTDYRAKISAKR